MMCAARMAERLGLFIVCSKWVRPASWWLAGSVVEVGMVGLAGETQPVTANSLFAASKHSGYRGVAVTELD